MKVEKLKNNIFVFMFEDTIMITVLINRGKAILIDCGYKKHSQKVKEYLEKNDIKVTDIIYTHFHPDHMAGASIFEEVNLYCNKNYNDNYDYFIAKEDDTVVLRKPTILVCEDEFIINDFKISITHGPGHSICSSIILIDDEVLCAGDLMMRDMNNMPALPGICYDGGAKMHLESLQKILELKPRFLVIGHGKPILDSDEIRIEVNKRMYYLEKLIEANGDISLDNCIIDEKSNWILQEAHMSNVKYYNK